jgi:hypothetical protein
MLRIHPANLALGVSACAVSFSAIGAPFRVDRQAHCQ